MPKSPPILPDSLRDAEAVVPEESDASRPEEVKSRRVIELPPPPTPERRKATPQVRVEESIESGWRRWWTYAGRRLSSGCVVSFLFHFCLIMLLGLFVISSGSGGAPGLIAYSDDDATAPLEFVGQSGEFEPLDPDQADGSTMAAELPLPSPTFEDPWRESHEESDAEGFGAPSASMATLDLMQSVDADVRGGLAGRGREGRRALALSEGGSEASESAVERGLKWLATQQRPDGSFSFKELQNGCRYPGDVSSTTAATALVLLPFLGAGYTHTEESEYQDLMRRALYYLSTRALNTPHGLDLQEGTMYAQGIATIALCEAYAMTEDPELRALAQRSLDFVVYAQDKRGGGWRYTPGEPGDTTVTGWQLMAVKSGQMAGLRVPSPTIFLVQHFLDSVQSDYGAKYGYMDPNPRETTTAVGLLCRMYTGWERDHPGLVGGATYLSKWGPSEDNLYYNYYATQVLHHFGGTLWQEWNEEMREYLIASQSNRGHEAGSWFFLGGHGDKGGRLYNTAMAVMTLEVYYRYMPLYRQAALANDF